LTHTSGLYDYVRDIDDEDSAISCHPVDKQLVLDLVFKHDLDFKPGTQFRYCNSGYYLLGLIIEKVTGKSYEQNIRDIIFTPLQMTHSLFDFNIQQIQIWLQVINQFPVQIKQKQVRGDGTRLFPTPPVQFGALQEICINGRRQSPTNKFFLLIHGKLHSHRIRSVRLRLVYRFVV
jgi:CubicO group peptidase (beta-lactamase class C family)